MGLSLCQGLYIGAVVVDHIGPTTGVIAFVGQDKRTVVCRNLEFVRATSNVNCFCWFLEDRLICIHIGDGETACLQFYVAIFNQISTVSTHHDVGFVVGCERECAPLRSQRVQAVVVSGGQTDMACLRLRSARCRELAVRQAQPARQGTPVGAVGRPFRLVSQAVAVVHIPESRSDVVLKRFTQVQGFGGQSGLDGRRVVGACDGDGLGLSHPGAMRIHHVIRHHNRLCGARCEAVEGRVCRINGQGIAAQGQTGRCSQSFIAVAHLVANVLQ